MGVRCKQHLESDSKFTNFALEPGGKHIGEVLGEGRFTVLSPTVGISGEPYINVNRVMPVKVEFLESIGIYSCKSKANEKQPRSLPKASYSFAQVIGCISLKDLICDGAKAIMTGGEIDKGKRSDALTTFGNELFGWVNWCNSKGIGISDNPEALFKNVQKTIGASDKENRGLASLSIDSVVPAAFDKGGDKPCWKRIRKFDKATYNQCCPESIKAEIETEYKEYNDRAKTVDSEWSKSEWDESVEEVKEEERERKRLKEACFDDESEHNEDFYFKGIWKDLLGGKLRDSMRNRYPALATLLDARLFGVCPADVEIIHPLRNEGNVPPVISSFI